jgi:CheY-like chemotaxis protein
MTHAPEPSQETDKHILIVDDDQNHRLLTRIALERTGLGAQVHDAEDGADCLAFLRREGRHASAPRPDLIFLDVNMPRMSGPHVMTEIMADSRLRTMPVVAMSMSGAEKDVRGMYEAGCSSYFVKPINFDEFVAAMKAMTDHWLGGNNGRLPHRPA